jgi:predicted small secreted protein
MKRTTLALVLLAALAACNTVDGIGRDISSGAQTVQRAF